LGEQENSLISGAADLGLGYGISHKNAGSLVALVYVIFATEDAHRF
jgi:hypothetical protein